MIVEVASTIPAPLNVMLWPNLPPFRDLAAAGVRRLSQGGSAFLQTVGYLAHMTTNFVDGEDPAVFGGAIEPGYRLLPGLARPRRR